MSFIECDVICILWINKIESFVECSYCKIIIVSITFDEKKDQDFQHLSFDWHYDACDLRELILFPFVMYIYMNVESSVSFRGVFNGCISLQVQIGCRISNSPQ